MLVNTMAMPCSSAAAITSSSRIEPPGWMMPLLARLQEGAPEVKALLAPGGAAEIAPRFFRLRLELLEFTTPEERRETGRVWKATPLPQYTIQGELQPGPR